MLENFFNNLPGSELYKDLFKPGMQKAGEALATVIDGANLILLPLKLVNEKSKVYFVKNLERYSEKINANESLKITQVPQYVGLPIIDKLTYLNENELSEAFINLLTKASFEETLKLVHPAYLAILERMSADEAKILYYFKDTEYIPFIDFYVHRYIETIKKPDCYDKQGSKTREELNQIIEYNNQDRQHTYIKAAWNLTGIENELDLMFPENIDIYIENLELNGLITFERKLHHKDDEAKYEKLIKDYEKTVEKINSEIEVHKTEFELEIETRRGYIHFTDLGKGFLQSCIKEIE